jgi:hypothetical protein
MSIHCFVASLTQSNINIYNLFLFTFGMELIFFLLVWSGLYQLSNGVIYRVLGPLFPWLSMPFRLSDWLVVVFVVALVESFIFIHIRNGTHFSFHGSDQILISVFVLNCWSVTEVVEMVNKWLKSYFCAIVEDVCFAIIDLSTQKNSHL